MADSVEGETGMSPAAIHQRVIDLPGRAENKTPPGAARARVAGGCVHSISPDMRQYQDV